MRPLGLIYLLIFLFFIFYPRLVQTSGIGFRNFDGNITVRNSTFDGNTTGIQTTITNGQSARHIWIDSNTILNSERAGIKIDLGGALPASIPATIENNTLDNSNVTSNGRFGIWVKNKLPTFPSEAINKRILGYAKDEGIEKGRKTRTDCTAVLSDIHDPTDSSLLYDSVRVLARNLSKAKEELPGLSFSFQDHTRRAKRRDLGIMNAKGEKARKKGYQDLLLVTQRTIRYAQAAIPELQVYTGGDLIQMALAQGCAQELEHYIGLALKVVNQTRRRVFKEKKVPASEKIVSIFEPHTDIIKKDKRDTFYGHKVCLTGGSSNLILDCVILDGNPADSTLSDQMLDRQKDIYGRYPLKTSFDGGFASKANLMVS